MATRHSRFWPVLLLVLVCLCAQPVEVEAQCVVGMPIVNTFPGVRSVYYVLTAPGTCVNVASNNVLACLPSAGPVVTTLLLASASTAATNPSCSWQCICGTVTQTFVIDGSVGLPVELMEFAIEDGEPPEGAGGEGGEASEEAGGEEEAEASASEPPDDASSEDVEEVP